MNSKMTPKTTSKITCTLAAPQWAATPTMSKAAPALATALLLAAALLTPTDASAYVGPGAGLSLLGALWALVAAVATAVLFVLAWPVRRFLRRRRAAGAKPQADTAPLDGTSQSNLDQQD